MANNEEVKTPPPDLVSDAARQLSSSTKSAPFWSPRTPRWTLECLRACAMLEVDGGVYQVNKVVDDEQGAVVYPKAPLNLPSSTLRASYSQPDGAPVKTSVGSYQLNPRSVALQTIQSIVRIPSRVPALFSDNHDQLQTQLRVTSEFIYETMENLIFNHQDYGLLNNVEQRMQFKVDGAPTPDVLDDLLALAWRRPDCFCMHPETLAEFRKRANSQSLDLEEVEIFGSPFTAWRSLPIVPTNKLWLLERNPAPSSERFQVTERKAKKGKAETNGSIRRTPGGATTSVLLMRLGLEKQGVVCLCAKGLEANAQFPYIKVEFMGLNDGAVASYVMSTHTAMAVLSSGALARADVVI
jgi:Phage capsid-like protein